MEWIEMQAWQATSANAVRQIMAYCGFFINSY